MKTTVSKWAAKAAGAGAVALLLATPSFAQSRGDWGRNNTPDRNQQTTVAARGNDNRSNNSGYRENQRVTESGKVSSFSRERDGYRVQLDRGRSFWVPQATFGTRYRDLRPGVSISLGGIFRGGSVYFDAVTWPGAAVYNNGSVRGVIQSVNYRGGTILVRQDGTGRLITAGVTQRGLRAGDYVQLTGQFIRGGVFDVSGVENIRNRRY